MNWTKMYEVDKNAGKFYWRYRAEQIYNNKREYPQVLYQLEKVFYLLCLDKRRTLYILPEVITKLRTVWGMNEWMTTLFKGAVSLWNVFCNLSRNVLVTLWQDRLHETISQCRIPCNGQNHCEKSCTKSTIKLNSVFG